MKILYVIHQYFPHYYTGTELLTDNISRYQRYLGDSVEIWAYNLAEPDVKKIEKTSYHETPVTFFSHHNKDKKKDWRFYWKDKENREYFKKLLKKVNPDVLHVTHSARMSDIVAAAYDLGIPYVTTITDYWLLCPTATLVRKNGDLCGGSGADPRCLRVDYKNNLQDFEERWGGVKDFLKNASRVGYAANFVRAMFEKNGIDTSNWIHIKHGYNASAKRIRTQDPYYRFAYTGTLQPSKGAHIAIEAFRSLPEENARLVVYGEIGHDNTYSKYCLGLAQGDPRIEFRGKYDHNNLVDEFKDVDCILIPSVWYEPFPFTLINAIKFGYDVLGARIGGIPELIGENNSESLFAAGDSNDLKEKMLSKLNKGKNTPQKIFYEQALETEAFKYFQVYNLLKGAKV